MSKTKIVLLSLFVGVLLIVMPIGCVIVGWLGEAAQVAREELGPRNLLRKYEWFKDTAAGLHKLRADIQVYQSRLDGMAEDYRDISIKDWPRDMREQRSIWRSEVAGVKSRYNDVSADYNAQMAKVNWRFCNIGGLPEGATEVLPREFSVYISD
jgi:hypothetical protein